MLIKFKLTEGRKEFVHAPEFYVGPVKDWKPDVLAITICNDQGKKLASYKRPNAKHYEKYDYVPQPEQPEPAADPVAPEMPEEPMRNPGEDQPEGSEQ